MQVLVGVDGSAGSVEAVRVLGSLLDPRRDRVAMYYTPPSVKLKSSAPVSDEVKHAAGEALAKAVFDQAYEALPAPLRAQRDAIVGSQRPSHGITVAADNCRASLIVVGARGHGPIERLLVGSVSKAVAETSHLPVLVVRPLADSAARPWRVLLAVDEQTSAAHVSELLGQLQWPAGTMGTLVTVIESMFAGEIPAWLEQQARDQEIEAMAKAWSVEHEAERQTTRGKLLELRKTLPAIFQQTEPVVAEGNPADEVLKLAAAEQADLIVIGSRNTGRFARMVLGSTSHKVLAYATCSVLVLPQVEQP